MHDLLTRYGKVPKTLSFKVYVRKGEIRLVEGEGIHPTKVGNRFYVQISINTLRKAGAKDEGLYSVEAYKNGYKIKLR